MKWLWIGLGLVFVRSLNTIHSATKLDFTVRGLSWHESFSKLTILLSVYNPSNTPCIITSGLIHVTVQNIEIGTVRIIQPININPNGYTNLSVDCFPSFVNVLVQIYNMVIKQKLKQFNFNFNGSLNVSIGSTIVNTTVPVNVNYMMEVSQWK